MMGIDRDRLLYLFESNKKSKLPYVEELIRMESSGDISIEEFDYTPTIEIPWFLNGSKKEKSGESLRHKKLKRYASAYLLETGCSSVNIEEKAWFGRADVGCSEENRYAECGTVRVEKFVQAFGVETNLDLIGEPSDRYDIVDEIAYIPYFLNENAPPIRMISFKDKK